MLTPAIIALNPGGMAAEPGPAYMDWKKPIEVRIED